MLPPMKFKVPAGTKSIYLTAISLCKTTSQASVTWSDGSATFGATFVGPNEKYVLRDRVFKMPVITIKDSIPSELLVSFNFNDSMTRQHSVAKPSAEAVGPEGNATEIQISGYDASDKEKEAPTTLTILFQTVFHADALQN